MCDSKCGNITPNQIEELLANQKTMIHALNRILIAIRFLPQTDQPVDTISQIYIPEFREKKSL